MIPTRFARVQAHLSHAVFAAFLCVGVPLALHAQPVPADTASPESAPVPEAPSAGAGTDGATDSPPIGETMAEFARSEYRSNVRVAIAAVNLLTVDWLMKPFDKLIAKGKPFDDQVAKGMSMHAQTLGSIGAPMFELEVPALYAEWNKTMRLMDRAEAAKLYQPPEDLRKMLVFWRAKRDDQAAIDAAPWVKGPAQVAFDPNLAEIQIPADVQYLDPTQCAALKNQRQEIRRLARAAFTGQPATPANANTALPGVGCLRAANGAWTASIAMVNRGYMLLDPEFPSHAAHLLTQVRSRSNPMSRLDFKTDNGYSEAAVRWAIVPTIEADHAVARWSLTDGLQKQPTRIDYAFLKFGAEQQVLISADELRAAEVVTEIDDLPAGYAKEKFTVEYAVGQMRQALAPLEQSLAFLPGHRYEDANAQTPRNPNTLDFLVAGGPSVMERSVANIIKQQERKENFFLFLWDHPRYLAMLLLAIGVVLSAVSKARARND